MSKIELKPCPFCGEHLERSDALSTRGNTVYLHPVSDPLCLSQFVVGSSDAHRVAAWNTRTDATKDAEIKRLREALNGKFCALFLDGRNEHGSHVLPSFPTSIDISPEDLTSDDAEHIIKSAESEGFSVGDTVWAEFEWMPPQVGDFARVEFEGYWIFKRIDAEMTRALSPIPDPAGGMPVEVET